LENLQAKVVFVNGCRVIEIPHLVTAFRTIASTTLLWTAARSVLATVLTPVGPEKIVGDDEGLLGSNARQQRNLRLPAREFAAE
jgi:hypothetical protein